MNDPIIELKKYFRKKSDKLLGINSLTYDEFCKRVDDEIHPDLFYSDGRGNPILKYSDMVKCHAHYLWVSKFAGYEFNNQHALYDYYLEITIQ